MWKYYAVLAAVFAALTTIFSKVGLKNVNPDLATGIRVFFILIIIGSVVVHGGHWGEIKTFSRENWIFLGLSAVATGLSWLFYYRALQIGDAVGVSSVDKLSIVFTLVFAVVFLKEPLTLKTVFGSMLVFAGTLVLLLK